MANCGYDDDDTTSLPDETGEIPYDPDVDGVDTEDDDDDTDLDEYDYEDDVDNVE